LLRATASAASENLRSSVYAVCLARTDGTSRDSQLSGLAIWRSGGIFVMSGTEVALCPLKGHLLNLVSDSAWNDGGWGVGGGGRGYGAVVVRKTGCTQAPDPTLTPPRSLVISRVAMCPQAIATFRQRRTNCVEAVAWTFGRSLHAPFAESAGGPALGEDTSWR